MTIERACAQAHEKPWGAYDLEPWSSLGVNPTGKGDCTGTAIGEIWFERADSAAGRSALLLKLLFTRQPLSIQVHPDDAYARSLGQANGKTEAWYILSALPHAKVALGLTEHRTTQELRSAAVDGSLEQLVSWQDVSAGQAILVPAGTIHAIGADLVIVEIQQRSDTTFRLSDEGRGRELHIDQAIATAILGPALPQSHPKRLTDVRTLLVSSRYFVLERIDLAPESAWRLGATSETWLLVLSGDGLVGPHGVRRGDAIFADCDAVDIQAGAAGIEFLVAYVGGPNPARDLLEQRDRAGSRPCDFTAAPQVPASPSSTHIASPDRGRRLSS